MKIGFVGAGKVGTAFAQYLFKKDSHISGFFNRSKEKANNICALTNSTNFENLKQLVKHSDLIFITTNDDQISVVVKDIVESCRILDEKSIGHMSGAIASDILLPLQNLGASVFSLHPMQSFADLDKSVSDLENTFFGFESQKKDDQVISLLNKLGNPCLSLEPSQKPLYHITSCIVSNYLTTLIHFAFDQMQKIGFDQQTSLTALKPMILGTFANIEKLGTAKALTGPIARGDVQTIQKHLTELVDQPEMQTQLYKVLGKATLELAGKSNTISEHKLNSLRQLLK